MPGKCLGSELPRCVPAAVVDGADVRTRLCPGNMPPVIRPQAHSMARGAIPHFAGHGLVEIWSNVHTVFRFRAISFTDRHPAAELSLLSIVAADF